MINLKDANQLLIQQKLELQGKIDNANSALEQEKQKHQAVKDQLKKREEELKKECDEIEAKLVSMLERMRLLFCEHAFGFFQGQKRSNGLTLVSLYMSF